MCSNHHSPRIAMIFLALACAAAFRATPASAQTIYYGEVDHESSS